MRHHLLLIVTLEIQWTSGTREHGIKMVSRRKGLGARVHVKLYGLWAGDSFYKMKKKKKLLECFDKRLTHLGLKRFRSREVQTCVFLDVRRCLQRQDMNITLEIPGRVDVSLTPTRVSFPAFWRTVNAPCYYLSECELDSIGELSSLGFYANAAATHRSVLPPTCCSVTKAAVFVGRIGKWGNLIQACVA